MIINEAAARKYFPAESAIGRTASVDDVERTIVGVVGDVYQTSLEIGPRTEVYVPLSQSVVGSGELVIRTTTAEPVRRPAAGQGRGAGAHARCAAAQCAARWRS